MSAIVFHFRKCKILFKGHTILTKIIRINLFCCEMHIIGTKCIWQSMNMIIFLMAMFLCYNNHDVLNETFVIVDDADFCISIIARKRWIIIVRLFFS